MAEVPGALAETITIVDAVYSGILKYGGALGPVGRVGQATLIGIDAISGGLLAGASNGAFDGRAASAASFSFGIGTGVGLAAQASTEGDDTYSLAADAEGDIVIIGEGVDAIASGGPEDRLFVRVSTIAEDGSVSRQAVPIMGGWRGGAILAPRG